MCFILICFLHTVLVILITSSVGGGVLPDFFFLVSFTCSADLERDWPLLCEVFFSR